MMIIYTLEITLDILIVVLDYRYKFIYGSNIIPFLKLGLEDKLSLVKNDAKRGFVEIQEFDHLIIFSLCKVYFCIELHKILWKRIS
jgi:hypothetical protein